MNKPQLAWDTSTPTLSIALRVPRLAAVLVNTQSEGLPSATLLPAIASLLASVRLNLSAFSALIVGMGPGSFTGLRVAMATAKGLAMGSGVPLVGVCSLAAMVYPQAAFYQPETLLGAVLLARLGFCVAAVYRVTLMQQLEVVLPANTYAVGDAALRLYLDNNANFFFTESSQQTALTTQLLLKSPLKISPPSALAMLHLFKQPQFSKHDTLTSLRPHYSRLPVVKKTSS